MRRRLTACLGCQSSTSCEGAPLDGFLDIASIGQPFLLMGSIGLVDPREVGKLNRFQGIFAQRTIVLGGCAIFKAGPRQTESLWNPIFVDQASHQPKHLIGCHFCSRQRLLAVLTDAIRDVSNSIETANNVSDRSPTNRIRRPHVQKTLSCTSIAVRAGIDCPISWGSEAAKASRSTSPILWW
jgi:hypothetical protein